MFFPSVWCALTRSSALKGTSGVRGPVCSRANVSFFRSSCSWVIDSSAAHRVWSSGRSPHAWAAECSYSSAVAAVVWLGRLSRGAVDSEGGRQQTGLRDDRASVWLLSLTSRRVTEVHFSQALSGPYLPSWTAAVSRNRGGRGEDRPRLRQRRSPVTHMCFIMGVRREEDNLAPLTLRSGLRRSRWMRSYTGKGSHCN